MGILDGIVEWIAEQVMNLLDMLGGSILGALGCDMTTFLRYFPAAETMYSIFVGLGLGLLLLNFVWQLFRNFGLGIGVEAEDPLKLTCKTILFVMIVFFAEDIVNLAMQIGGTPYQWIVDADLPPIQFASFMSVATTVVTLYAHYSKILVAESQHVDAGQVIAKVGLAGWATGPHLHIEVIINGQPQNPLDYISNG